MRCLAHYKGLRQRPGSSFPLGRQHSPRQALQTWVDSFRHSSAWAAHRYAQARDSRICHPHAVRILVRAGLHVMRACWQMQHTL